MRLLAIFLCPFAFGLGLAFLGYGCFGVRYAFTASPSVDFAGDLWGASLMVLIGLLLASFAARWFYLALRRPFDGSGSDL